MADGEELHPLPDIIGRGLDVAFCGINPGRYSGATGHHFAKPGNRFWPALHRAGFTDERLSAVEDVRLLDCGLGVTNLVERTTTSAAELSTDELRSGAARLVEKVEHFEPTFLAVLGVQAYRSAFRLPKAGIGLQLMTIGRTRLWVVPNPSGLQAYYSLDDIVDCLSALRSVARP